MAPPPTAPLPPDAAALNRALARMARADAAPWLHQEVARRMAERLSWIKAQPAAWLDWSAWLGGGAQAVRQAYPAARRLVMEPTPALAARSAREARGGWWPLVRDRATVLQPEQEAPCEIGLLWSNMALHLMADAPGVLAQWHRRLAVGGFLMFSTVGPDTLAELNALYRDAGWGPPGQAHVDMHDLGDALVRAGFAEPVMDQELIRLSWSSAEAALQELRTLGANAHPQRHAGLRTPGWRRRLLQALDGRRDAQGRITLRFEIVYGHAMRAAPRPRAGEPVTVDLQTLRASLRSVPGRSGGG